MVSFSDMDATIGDLKERLKALHEQMMYVASIVKKFRNASQFFSEKEREKKHLEAQLRSLEQNVRSVQVPPSSQLPFIII
ncbi:hypothetical protein LguiB_013441 [Lonicera macranthoides]